jgi:alkylation response protein AidB-like acyl-CoA dehydrogenase
MDAFVADAHAAAAAAYAGTVTMISAKSAAAAKCAAVATTPAVATSSLAGGSASATTISDTGALGTMLAQPWGQQAVARVEAQVAAYKILNLRVNASMSSKGLGMGEASAAKVFGTELTQQVARELLDVIGQDGTRTGPDAPLKGDLEHAYRLAVINTFGGGANELQRDIIAMAGLLMPRAPRDMRATAS